MRDYFDNFSVDQLDNLFSAVIELGGLQIYVEDDDDDASGFFNFIDYVTAIAYSCGEAATDKLKNYPDSPRNQHYIHYIKQYLSDERFYSSILQKYPYCSR